jgi:hypothetical protein
MKQKLITLTVVLILLLALAPPALAQGPDGSRVIFGSNFTLEAEQTVDGDVVVFGGNATIEKSGTVEGDMAVFGGNVNIDGTVEGDVAAIGGNVNLGETAVVEGDIALLGGHTNVAEGAQVGGSVVRPFDNGFQFNFDHDFEGPKPPTPPQPPWAEARSWTDRVAGFFADLVWTVSLLLGLAAISWLVATFMPEQMKQVGDTVAEHGPVSFGLGLLTVVVSVVVGIPLLITICLAFIPILAYILIGIATLFGWIVIGQLIGERLLTSAGRPYPNFVVSTVIGVLVLTVISKMPVIGWIPCIGFIFWLIGFLIGMVVSLTGLGAVILTRFGTRPYTPRAYSGSGGGSAAYSPRGYGEERNYTDQELSDLNINSASEAELKAKIKAALAEADAEADDTPAPDSGETPEPEKPDAPSPDAPSTEDPDKATPSGS